MSDTGEFAPWKLPFPWSHQFEYFFPPFTELEELNIFETPACDSFG